MLRQLTILAGILTLTSANYSYYNSAYKVITYYDSYFGITTTYNYNFGKTTSSYSSYYYDDYDALYKSAKTV